MHRALEEADATDEAARYLAHHFLSLAHAEAGNGVRAAAERAAAEKCRGALDFEPDPMVFAVDEAERRGRRRSTGA